jgi:HD-like signal output (HDOD) protein
MIPTIKALTGGIQQGMGSYAPIIEEVEAVLQDPESNLTNVGEVIEKDPDLTARLLKLGNSSFYGFPTRLETVSAAVSLIGIQQVQDLIVATSVVETFAGVTPEFVNMESFWRHSLACGIGARFLAILKRMPNPEKFFVAGLLHDVGRLVLFSQVPKITQQIFELCRKKNVLLWEAETEILGYDHAQVGEALLRTWMYPGNLVHAVARHHHPLSSDLFRTESAIVHVADHLVNAAQIGSSGERHVPPLETKAWLLLNLPTDSLESVVASIDDQIEAVQEVFLKPKQPATGK